MIHGQPTVIGKRRVAISSLGVAWSTRITEPDLRAAPYHELIVSSRPVVRLDDLSADEESSCWNFAWERAVAALTRENMAAIALLVNDGRPACQSIQHAHFHIIGFDRDRSETSLPHELDTLSRSFTTACRRLGDSRDISIDMRDPAAIRAARQDLARTRPDAGFSIMTRRPFNAAGLRSPIPFTMESWNADRPREFTTTNLLRVMHGYRTHPGKIMHSPADRIFAPVD